MKTKFFISLSIVAAAVLIAYSQIVKKPFVPAADFPRQALIYVQIADLPATIKLWNESEFKTKYLESTNFNDFQKNHLGRKLASRWQEFSDAAGFPIDAETLASVAANQAALAVYDVGKLEFVFIAPVSDEVFAATQFAVNRDKFTEEALSDGTSVHRVKVEADRGRQTQELIFAQVKGRFVLATSEKLLAQTLHNINGGAAANRLIDEPRFALLSETIVPHTATVWLDQKALNDDYYFRRYWLMSEVEDLKNMRAGIFDFQMQPGKLIERRKFLLGEPANTASIENAAAASLLSMVPPETAFYRLQSANAKTVGEALEKTLDVRRERQDKPTRNYYSNRLSFGDYSDYSGDGYESLGEEYDEAIDDTDDDDTFEKRRVEIDFFAAVQSANPRAILTFTQPKMMPAPLFAEFQRTAIFDCAAPESFRREDFERAIGRAIAAQMLIVAPDAPLNWKTITENGFARRDLNLPMLGRTISYVMRGDKLILTNDVGFLRELFAAPAAAKIEKQSSPFAALTVIDLAAKEAAYDQVFNELSRREMADDFFTRNISSLLAAASAVGKIEIKERYSQNIFDEEITVNFK